MGTRKKPTVVKMSDLAKLAGVSKSTVSRALAGNELVNKKTRDRIAALAREHNYRLNTQARNFRLKESYTVGVMIPSAEEARWQISDPFFLELIGAIAVALNERGHEMLLSSARLGKEDGLQDVLAKRNSDGLIFIGQSNLHETLNELAMIHPAMVVWGAHLPEQTYCSVGGDNFRGGQLATEHLLQQGCTRIAFMGNTETVENNLRYQGYCRALSDAGLPVDEGLLINTDNHRESAESSVQRFVDNGVAFDAIFATSDTYAMTAIRALDTRGLKVPQDVAVVGYDDISLSEFYSPPITSIHQDRAEGGRLLVDKVLAILDGERAQSSVLETKLVVRSSSQKA